MTRDAAPAFGFFVGMITASAGCGIIEFKFPGTHPMAPIKNPQDEFVDLYALLDLPPSADAARVRKTISELYLEAQKNLDHRNPRKRLQYQQMYEVYLPQARHLLLDAARRAEYDRYLQAFLSGQTVAAEPAAASAPGATQAGATEPARHSEAALPESQAAAPAKLPELSEAEQAQMWSKWKSGLQSAVQEEVAPGAPTATRSTPSAPRSTPAASQTPAPGTTATPGTAATPSASHHPAPRPAGARPAAKPAPRIAGAPAASEESDEERHRREAAEFQRQQRRMQMIRAAVQTSGLMWRLVAGVGAFALGCLLVLGLDIFLAPRGHYPLGLSRGLFNGLGILIVLIIALIAGNSASRRARRQKNLELSLLSYQELLHRIG
jgi:hypothetical protein